MTNFTVTMRGTGFVDGCYHDLKRARQVMRVWEKRYPGHVFCIVVTDYTPAAVMDNARYLPRVYWSSQRGDR